MSPYSYESQIALRFTEISSKWNQICISFNLVLNTLLHIWARVMHVLDSGSHCSQWTIVWSLLVFLHFSIHALWPLNSNLFEELFLLTILCRLSSNSIVFFMRNCTYEGQFIRIFQVDTQMVYFLNFLVKSRICGDLSIALEPLFQSLVLFFSVKLFYYQFKLTSSKNNSHAARKRMYLCQCALVNSSILSPWWH